MDDELTVGALDGDDLQLPAPVVGPDPRGDDGLGDVVGFDEGGGGVDDVLLAVRARKCLRTDAPEGSRCTDPDERWRDLSGACGYRG